LYDVGTAALPADALTLLLLVHSVASNAAVIAVTHDEKVFDRFDRMFMLRDGRLGDIVRIPEAA
jgi:putative ABC transport system ATP-binding protein